MSSQLEAEARRTLVELRGALSPSSEDAARVRAALLMAAGQSSQRSESAPAVARGAVWKWSAALAGMAALFATLGYLVWGQRAVPLTAAHAEVSGFGSRPVQLDQAQRPVERRGARDLQSVDLPAAGAPTPAPRPESRGAAAARAQPRARARNERHRHRSAVPEVLPAAQASPTDSFAEELRVLRRVEHSQREGRPELALSLLGQLDRDVPGGKLREERAAAFSIARCAVEPTAQAALLRDFAGHYPESVYRVRVERGCGLKLGGAAALPAAAEKSRQTSATPDTSLQEPRPRR